MSFDEYCEANSITEVDRPAAFERWMKLQFAAGLQEGTADD